MSRQVTLEGRITQTTLKAILFEPEGTGRESEVWIPRSVLLDGETLSLGDTDLVCAEWFAEKEGLA